MKKAIFVAVSVFLVLGCGQLRKVKQTPSPTTTESGATVIASIDGQPITEEDIQEVSGTKLIQARMKLYQAQKDGINQIIEDKLLETEAQKQGVTKPVLLKNEVYSKIDINDKEIKAFYDENKVRMRGKSLEEMKSNVRGHLFREKQQELHGKLIKKLRKKSDVQVLIKAPRIEIDEGDFPATGPEKAPIRLVEFTDYECPFCGRVRETISEIQKEYKGKVRYVLRDYPLSFHKNAVKAHEAAHCAEEQGKYWEMNKKLFANQRDLQVENLKKYAKELELKTKNFNECLDSGKYEQKVQSSTSYGSSVGVSGTPAFFINGRMISGAQSVSAFKEVIDDELGMN